MRPTDEVRVLDLIESAIFQAAGGRERFVNELPFIFRQAIDELVDAPRTRRLRFSQLEPNEKTVLGIKVEAALRYFLGFARGKLDFVVAGRDVDVKYSSSGDWMMPPEVVGHFCILTQADEAKGTFSFGLFAALPERLRAGSNRDQKVGIRADARAFIRWLAKDVEYPPNIWEKMDQADIDYIFEPDDGTGRIVRLFEKHVGQPIHRYTIQTVARQHDYMKRVRANHGARDKLHPKGLFVLSGNQDGPLVRALGLPYLGRDFMMAFKPNTMDEARQIMKKTRHAKGFRFRDR